MTALPSRRPVFVVAAPQAFAAGLQPRSVDLKIWPSRALADGTIIAIEASAFVSAFGALPRIDISTEAVAHMVDTSPATEISAAGRAGRPGTSHQPCRVPPRCGVPQEPAYRDGRR